tara:strand:+ start:2119 stop:2562 length:444 start_codon:yes stop_codon:yes gene_type:complete
MTTIAYHHESNQVAVDSRSVISGTYDDNTNKVHKNKGRTFILCGSVCDFSYFIENFESLTTVKLDVELDTCGIMIENGKGYYVFVHSGAFNQEPLTANLCLGSGMNFATSALDFDETAKGAVEFASTRCIYTGGKVHVYDIEKGELI